VARSTRYGHPEVLGVLVEQVGAVDTSRIDEALKTVLGLR
jgi:hypothetical protein